VWVFFGLHIFWHGSCYNNLRANLKVARSIRSHPLAIKVILPQQKQAVNKKDEATEWPVPRFYLFYGLGYCWKNREHSGDVSIGDNMLVEC